MLVPLNYEEAEEPAEGPEIPPVLPQDEAGPVLDVPAGELLQAPQPDREGHHQVEGEFMPREPRKLNLLVSKLTFQVYLY